MVSKVAVIALVAIVSCPILLGYAFNLSETEETIYESNNDPINVTPLLFTGTGYSYAHADALQLNTSFLYSADQPVFPEYKSYATNRTSLNLKHEVFPHLTVTPVSGTFSDMYYLNNKYEYNPSNGYLTAYVTYDNNGVNTTASYIYIHTLYFDSKEDVLYLTQYSWTSPPNQWRINTVTTINHPISISYAKTGSFDASYEGIYSLKAGTDRYVDLSAGFRLNTYSDMPDGAEIPTWLELPTAPRSALLTLDLSTITDSSAVFVLAPHQLSNNLYFKKTTDVDGAHWALYQANFGADLDNIDPIISDLYYDATKSSNTYQLYLDDYGFSLRYVGDWPTYIGQANYYLNYDFDWTYNIGLSTTSHIMIRGHTPIMRVDDAEYRAFEYQVLEDVTYNPSRFKLNPETTISNPILYGSSITFGGNTYTVKDGNITLGSHQLPVKDLKFSSVAVIGGYENRIGNTVVSTTADPSTITFNGQWSASISTSSMTEKTITKTEWNAGQFGWDGMDQNFLMTGLLTSIGVFIALGIYIRRTKAALWPLLIVCGGAAALFFIML